MAVTASDFFLAERGGSAYKLTGQDLLDFIRDNFGTTNYKVADIAARNALANLSLGDIVLVDDASADANVTAGWAMYQYLGVGTWQKVAEEESLDIVITTTNLGTSTTTTTVTITNSDGTDATINVATETDAGVMSAADKALINLLTVTGAVDLDAIAAASHPAASADGTAATNPVTVAAGQIIGFSISGLATLP